MEQKSIRAGASKRNRVESERDCYREGVTIPLLAPALLLYPPIEAP